MLKKLLSIGVLASVMAFANTGIAQETPEYPHYGFWSNWSIGASVDFAKQGNMGWDFKQGTNIGATFMFEKELNYVWDLRLSLAAPGLLIADEDADWTFDRYVNAAISFKFSINDAIKGYNPDRRGSLYLLAGGGLGFQRTQAGVSKPMILDEWHTTVFAQIGLGFSYKVCKHSTLFLEVIADDHAFLPKFVDHRAMADIYASLGYLYNFGPTAADEALIAQKALLTQENFDALNNKVDNLEKELLAAKQNEQKLKNRIAELEDELANVPQGNTAAADSLQKVIDQIKADQMTYYALPFSVLFDVDQYKVNDTEMVKIDAVARVMKDNPDVKFNLYGFCDHTGSDAYNQKLSEKRVNEVKRLLVKKGIAEDRLTCEGKGKSVSFGDSKYAVNRRVSFYRVIE